MGLIFCLSGVSVLFLDLMQSVFSFILFIFLKKQQYYLKCIKKINKTPHYYCKNWALSSIGPSLWYVLY